MELSVSPWALLLLVTEPITLGETPSALGDPTLWKPRFTDATDNGAGIADVPDSLCTRISENLEAKEGLPGCLLRVALS